MNEVAIITHKLANNSISSFLRYFITVPLLLGVTPYVLNQLGPEQFGVWAIFGIITAYANLGDLGITSSLVRFIAKYNATREFKSINRLVSTVLVIYLITGGITGSILILSSRNLISLIFKLPEIYLELAIFVISGAALAFFITLISGIFGSILQGFHRMDLWNLGMTLYSIIDAAGAVIALKLGYGLKGLVISRLISCSLVVVINYFAVQKIFPYLRWKISNFDVESCKEILGYSANIFVSKIAIVAKEPLTKVIILQLTSLTSITFFDLSARIANQARGMFSAMLLPLLAASSGIQSIGGDEATRRLFFQATRYVIYLVLPIFGGLIIFSHLIIHLWLGPGFDVVALTLQGLLVGFFFALLYTPAFIIMEGIGLAKTTAAISLISASINLIFGIGLGIRFGYFGVVWGYILTPVITSVITILIFCWKLSIPYHESLQVVPLRAIIFSSCAMFLSGLFLEKLTLNYFMELLLVGSFYCVLSTAGLFMTGAFRPDRFIYIKRWLVGFAK